MKKLINVDHTFSGMRIDRFLRKYFVSIPQSLIEKNLRNGKIKLNKKRVKSSNKVKNNDVIELHNFEYKKDELVKKKIFVPSNTIIKENENFIIDIFSKSEIFKDDKPYSVHRLDKETSGVFLIAKNRSTAQLLTSLFRLRKVYKTYIAICRGELDIEDKGIFKNNLIRYDNDKKIIEKAETNYEILDKNNNSTFIQLNPITGRKHQLRKQLYNLGHSIIGDKKYNSFKNQKNNKNLMLHSYEIKFKIKDKKYTFRAIPPQYFRNMLNIKRLNF